MGERQIRAQADQTAVEALRPQFDALGALAVAAANAGKANEVRAAAQRKAQQIRDNAEAAVARLFEDTEAEIAQLEEEHRRAWQGAISAGWQAQTLRAAPINQQRPVASRGRKRGTKKRAVKASLSPSTSNGPVPEQRVHEDDKVATWTIPEVAQST